MSSTHTQGVGRLPGDQAARTTARVAGLSVLVAVFLICLKAWAWFMTGSIAMLASLADSTLDFAASLFTLFAVRYAAAPPDAEHRFGHGKAEAFAGLVQAGLVALSAALVVLEAVRHLADPVPIRAGAEGVFVMLVSVVVTAGLIYAQSRAIKATVSVATLGDRAHYAADLGANFVALSGIVAAAFFDIGWADALAGIVVAFWLRFGAWDVARRSADHLLDRELSEEDRARIRTLAMTGGGVRGVHGLRTRASGPYVHIQFHADLDPTLSLKDAHAIMVAAEDRIRAEFPAADVLVHPDPRGFAEPHGHEGFQEGRGAAEV